MQLLQFPEPQPKTTLGELCDSIGAESVTVHYKRDRGYLVSFYKPGQPSGYGLNVDLTKAVAEARRKCQK